MPTPVENSKLRLQLLGSAAGGGYPQWNCQCDSCHLAWSKQTLPQTQFSLAFSDNAADWHLINASPDIRQQILQTPILAPINTRVSPIKSVWLTNADIDSTAGLFMLREQSPLMIYATADVLHSITVNPYFRAFNPALVKLQEITPNKRIAFTTDLTLVPLSVPGKVPLYEEEMGSQGKAQYSVAYVIEHQKSGLSVLVCPGTASITPAVLAACEKAHLVFMDGTLWSNEELIQQSLRQRTGEQMAHLPMAGETGSLEQLKTITAEKVFVHVNNSNPVWDPNSDAHKKIRQSGWVLGQQGMEWALC